MPASSTSTLSGNISRPQRRKTQSLQAESKEKKYTAFLNLLRAFRTKWHANRYRRQAKCGGREAIDALAQSGARRFSIGLGTGNAIVHPGGNLLDEGPFVADAAIEASDDRTASSCAKRWRDAAESSRTGAQDGNGEPITSAIQRALLKNAIAASRLANTRIPGVQSPRNRLHANILL